MSGVDGTAALNAAKPKALPKAAEFAWARQRRADFRAAGGVLDLVLPLRAGGEGPALFCAPPLVGASWCYLSLLPHIGPEHAVYGLQSRGLRRPEPLTVDMAELARDFADRIRETRPCGPYPLFGWSVGANMAHAIAEELERRGEDVGLLVIGDATPQLPGKISIADDNVWLLCDFVLREFGYQPVIEPDDPDPVGHMLELIRARPGGGLHEWPDRRVVGLPRIIRNNLAVAQRHEPGRVRCPVLFLSATRTEETTAEKVAAWAGHLDGPVDVVEVDTEHEHMLLPQPIARIGAAIAARLRALG
ncbi:thioesterase domain-containing protein [Labedaea rhizosphaerae]|uniref:Thioesterase domain-containing protein n=1 Tax=Labedaea rhizosphaerae TaxID=598644 RepID=A0A4R6S0H0_LABRH|nr:thioesterase domain-containing protein [Labedaea rhizosphaerae]TDP92999.1 thioesterase domain-containing protein [Labedaea rhizosphaerae]